MPETATDRGLDNPFDPLQAIPASARLLHDLYQKFGNLGLAAAAYNAGPGRVADWLANKSQLPQETQDYVNAITGRAPETWKAAVQAGSPAVKFPEDAPCQETAGLLAWNGPDQVPLPPPNPRAKDLADRAIVTPQSAVLGSNNSISHQRRAASSGTASADRTKLFIKVQGNKAYQCKLYGESKFCRLR